jgi:hypothetical protein
MFKHRFKNIDETSQGRASESAESPFVPFPLSALPAEHRDLAQWVYQRAQEQAASLDVARSLVDSWVPSMN